MDLGATHLWVKHPDANKITPGLEAGEWVLENRLNYFTEFITETTITCAAPCEEQVYTISFADVDFGDCNECGKKVAFVLILRRQANFDIQDYLHMTSRLPVTYGPSKIPSGVVTGAEFATWFEDYLSNEAYDDEHDFFGITAVASGSDLIITVPCPNKLDIYPDEYSELDPTQIVETTPGTDAILTKDQMQKLYPLMIGYIHGQRPDETFTGCEDVCVIDIRGCIPECVEPDKDLLTTQNAVHLHTTGTKFWYQIIVDSSAPGYADFIAALNASLPPAAQIPLVVANTSLVDNEPVVAGSDTALDLTGATTDAGGVVSDTFADGPISGSITNGNVTLQFSGIADVPALVAALNGAYPSTPPSFADSTAGDGIFEVVDASAFATGGTSITITID